MKFYQVYETAYTPVFGAIFGYAGLLQIRIKIKSHTVLVEPNGFFFRLLEFAVQGTRSLLS